ncbi:MAG: S-layer homology domain-containing protein [Faecousia sp.]
MKHHLISRLTVFFLLLCLFVQVIPFASAKQFSDVTRNQFPDYFDAINYVSDNGIMNGVSSTEFGPNIAVSRAVFITTLYRYAGSPSSYASIPFTDLSSSHWAYNAVRWGVKYNIVTGTSATTFEPDALITREQAMTFLWRFLYNYRNGTPYYHGSISGCTDYSSISSYARTPMYWAVSNAILYKSSNRIYPQSVVYRKELALWIMRYGQNVDGVRYGKDNFCFLNEESSFALDSSDRLRMTQYQYDMLIDGASETNLRHINNELNGQFCGVCFGMSLCVLLDKKGMIDFNSNFSKNTNTMYAMPSPSASSNKHIYVYDKNDGSTFPVSESVICFYSLARYRIEKFNYVRVETDQSEFYESFVNDLRTYGAAIFEYKAKYNNEIIGHVIAAYGMPKLVGEYYEIKYYDPNEQTEQLMRISSNYRTIDISFNGVSVTPYDTVYCADLFSLRALDIDGDYNKYPYASSSTNSITSSMSLTTDSQAACTSNEVWVGVYAEGCHTITNDSGEILNFDNGIVSGTMDVFEKKYMFNLDAPSVAYYRVPLSNSFTFETDTNAAFFTVNWGDLYRGFEGSSARIVTISPNEITALGTSMTYELYASAGIGSYRCYEMFGNDESFASLSIDDHIATANGNSSYQFYLESIVSNEIYADQVLESGGSSEIADIENG